jgi:hypothetical protein
MVQLRGNIKGGTSGQTAFTLPTDFRPPANLVVPCNSGGGFYLDGALEVKSTGSVLPWTGNNSLMSYAFEFSVTL